MDYVRLPSLQNNTPHADNPPQLGGAGGPAGLFAQLYVPHYFESCVVLSDAIIRSVQALAGYRISTTVGRIPVHTMTISRHTV